MPFRSIKSSLVKLLIITLLLASVAPHDAFAGGKTDIDKKFTCKGIDCLKKKPSLPGLPGGTKGMGRGDSCCSSDPESFTGRFWECRAAVVVNGVPSLCKAAPNNEDCKDVDDPALRNLAPTLGALSLNSYEDIQCGGRTTTLLSSSWKGNQIVRSDGSCALTGLDIYREITHKCVNNTIRTTGIEESKVTYDAQGIGTNVEFKGDFANYNSTSQLTERGFHSGSQRVTLKPDGSDYNYQPFIRHQRRTSAGYALCNPSGNQNLEECVNPGKCKYVRVNADWSYCNGIDDADGNATCNKADRHLEIADTFNSSCNRKPRTACSWKGDRTAQQGTINGKPVILTTVEWFHTQIYGLFLINEGPADSNWNGTYIENSSALPTKTGSVSQNELCASTPLYN